MLVAQVLSRRGDQEVLSAADTLARRWRLPAWSRTRWVVIAGALALAVRVGLIVLWPFHLTATTDAGDYQRLAVSLSSGHGWGVSHYAPGGGPTALRAPLYPLFIAGIYKVVGVHLTAARLGGAVLGAVSVIVSMLVTWSLWGRGTAIVAGLIGAVFPPMAVSSVGLMTEALAVPLELMAIAFALWYRNSRQLRWMGLAGLALGLAVLTRPNLAVLVVPVVLLAIVRPLAWRHVLAGSLVILVGTLVVTPWLVRDRLVFHQWVPVTTQSGVVLAGTYNHTSATAPGDSGTWIPYEWDKADAAMMAKYPHADEVEWSSLLQSAGLLYASSHPSYVLDVVYQNTRHMFDLVPLHFTQEDIETSFGVPALWGDADAVSLFVIAVLVIAGIVLTRRRGVPLAYWSAPVLLWITTVVLQGIPRFRVEIDPFFVQLAAVAVAGAVATVRSRTAALGPKLPAQSNLAAHPAPTPLPVAAGGGGKVEGRSGLDV